jgi:peroxiredoxin
MRVEIGARAPDFEARTWQGKELRLTDFRGQKLWLAFFRYASCPLCNLRVHHIIEGHAQWKEAGIEIVAVFQSPASSIDRYVGRQSPPFPIVPDPEERLYATYGLGASMRAFMSPMNLGRLNAAAMKGYIPGKVEGTMGRIPGDFLVDEEGVLREAYYGKVIADHIPMERVDAFLSS